MLMYNDETLRENIGVTFLQQATDIWNLYRYILLNKLCFFKMFHIYITVSFLLDYYRVGVY